MQAQTEHLDAVFTRLSECLEAFRRGEKLTNKKLALVEQVDDGKVGIFPVTGSQADILVVVNGRSVENGEQWTDSVADDVVSHAQTELGLTEFRPAIDFPEFVAVRIDLSS